MKKALSIVLSLIIFLTGVPVGIFSVNASSVNMGDFLKAYQQGDFVNADKIAVKLPENAKSYNSKMSAGMKNAYLKRILSTKNVEEYYLADITGDKKPELFIKTGRYHAEYKYNVFKLSKGKTVRIGRFDGGHSYLADYPGQKSVICVYGQMNYEQIYLIKLKNGKAKWTSINNRDCQNTGYTQVPYKLKSYYCGADDKYNLSPFAAKNTKAIKTAKKRLNKLVKRINSTIFGFYPKTKRINLSKKNKTIFAATSACNNGHRSYVDNKTVVKKNFVKSEYKNLFGGKPSFNSLSTKYKKHTSSSIGDEAYRRGEYIRCEVKGFYAPASNSDSLYEFMLPDTAKLECITKTKDGYRIAVAHYMRGYYEWESPADENVCFAHTYIDVKKYNKSKYRFIIKKINSIVYREH